MKGVSGISGAGPIWHDFMVTVVSATVRRLTSPGRMGWYAWRCPRILGLLPLRAEERRSGGAEENVSSFPPHLFTSSPVPIPCPQRRYEWFIAGTEPTEVDRSHVEVAVDARTGLPVDASTPPHYVQPQTIWRLPAGVRCVGTENEVPQLAQMEAAPGYTGTRGRGERTNMSQLAQMGVEQRAGGQANLPLLLRASALLPPGSPSPPLSLTSPDPNRTYTLDPGLPASAQQVPLTALSRDELSAGTPGITLLADDVPLAIVAAPDYTAWWPLTAGRHTFRAVSTRADGSRVESEPVTGCRVE